MYTRQQQEMKMKVVLKDDDLSFHADTLTSLRFVAGADISFVKDDGVNACAALVILNFPELEVLQV